MIDVLYELAAVGARLWLCREAQAERAADDGLDLGLGRVFRELERAEQVAAVGEPQGRHPIGLGEADQLLDLQGPLEQRVGRMNPQVDETDLIGNATHDAILFAPSVAKGRSRDAAGNPEPHSEAGSCYEDGHGFIGFRVQGSRFKVQGSGFASPKRWAKRLPS